MRKKEIQTTVVVGLTAMILTMTGCIHAPFVPPTGTAYNNYKAPLDVDFENTDMSGMKKGSAKTVSLLGLIAWGDASSQTAARAGGISTIQHADYEYLNVLGIFQKTTVIVYGK